MEIGCKQASLLFLSWQFIHFKELTGIRVLGNDTTVLEGAIANLTCKLIETNEELTQMTWQMKTRRYPENQNFLLITPSDGPKHVNGLGNHIKFIGSTRENIASIQLLNVSLEDEGVYTCICTVFPSGPIKTEITLTVQVPPTVTVAVEVPPVVGEQESTMATCTAATSKPPSEISWRTSNVEGQLQILTNTTHHTNSTTTVKSYLRATPSISMNQKEVQCIVTHPALREKTIPYRLDVHYHPQSVNTALSNNAQQGPVFLCTADANPPPSYTWYRLNQAMPSDVIKADGNRLQLQKRSSDLNGIYVCEATNPYGKVSGSLYVYIDSSRVTYAPLAAGIVLLCVAAAILGVFFYKQRCLQQEGERQPTGEQMKGQREGAEGTSDVDAVEMEEVQ